ncbi:MAG: CrcB family protein [Cellulomonadaceae bacterium]|jgi:CrcB protein|nr:CrcB family protein [Cellulomonadaceae bacterium]
MTGMEWWAFNVSPWMSWLLVAVGGGIGAGARFMLAGAITRRWASRLPWGTMTVNILGSFIIGLVSGGSSLLVAQLSSSTMPLAAADSWIHLGSLLLATGFCGGFTTFSTATVDSVMLAKEGHLARAVGSVAITLVATVAACVAGLLLVRAIFG